jgi:hypothetical protein
MTADAETYFDILRTLSDYWVSAGTQVQKDFYVTTAAALTPALVWKTRPFRLVAAGTETFVYGQNFTDYAVTYGGEVKNRILVYGKKTEFNPKDPLSLGRKQPTDGDAWTEDSTDWTMTVGTALADDAVDKVVGNSMAVTCQNVGGIFDTQIHIDGLGPYWIEGLEGYSQLEWWARAIGNPTTRHVRVYAPDDSNYFEADFTDPTGAWTHYIYALGKSNEYNSITNPDGKWTPVASANWDNIRGFEFQTANHANLTDWMKYDCLCLSFGRWRYTKTGSFVNYGRCDLVVVEDDLYGDVACQARAEAIYMQKSEPTRQLIFSVPGNSNVLIGDQLSITLPPEALTASLFDVAVLENTVDQNGWRTRVQAVQEIGGVGTQRELVPINPMQVLAKDLSRLGKVARGNRYIGHVLT